MSNSGLSPSSLGSSSQRKACWERLGAPSLPDDDMPRFRIGAECRRPPQGDFKRLNSCPAWQYCKPSRERLRGRGGIPNRLTIHSKATVAWGSLCVEFPGCQAPASRHPLHTALPGLWPTQTAMAHRGICLAMALLACALAAAPRALAATPAPEAAPGGTSADAGEEAGKGGCPL